MTRIHLFDVSNELQCVVGLLPIIQEVWQPLVPFGLNSDLDKETV